MQTAHATTILAVRKDGRVAIGSDGQVTLGHEIVKHGAKKIRRLGDGDVLVGFAGSAADAFALLERFEKRLSEYPGNLVRAATELAKEWRTDRALRRLESMMIVAGREELLVLGGSGDVIQPDDGVVAIGSGGGYAVAAARALAKHADLPAREMVEEGLAIAADLCVYTNHHITVEEL